MVYRSDIGAVVDAMYACISGPAGPRDWATQREIFHPESRQARTGLDADGRAGPGLVEDVLGFVRDLADGVRGARKGT